MIGLWEKKSITLMQTRTFDLEEQSGSSPITARPSPETSTNRNCHKPAASFLTETSFFTKSCLKFTGELIPEYFLWVPLRRRATAIAEFLCFRRWSVVGIMEWPEEWPWLRRVVVLDAMNRERKVYRQRYSKQKVKEQWDIKQKTKVDVDLEFQNIYVWWVMFAAD